jgi:putative polyhydroxyalkanoate system protein
MASIDIKKPHSLSKDEAKKRAEQLAKGMESQLGIKWEWQGDAIKFDAPSGAAKGTSGKVHVDDANVRVEVDLPFLLKAMKGTITTKIEEKLGDVLKT